MDAEALDRLAGRQHGLALTSQLRQLATDDEIEWWSEAGRIKPFRRKVWRVVGAPLTWQMAAMAAVLAAGEGAVLSHACAAFVHRLRGFNQQPDMIDVTVPAPRKIEMDGVRAHSTQFLSSFMTTVRDRIPVTTVARTIVDLSSVVSRWELGRIIDDALRRGLLKLDDLRRTFEALPPKGRRRARAVRAILGEHIPGYQPGASFAEREVYEWLLQAGFTNFELNVRVTVDRRKYELDIADRTRKIDLEFDDWHTHGAPTSFYKDIERDVELELAGWDVRRVAKNISRRPHHRGRTRRNRASRSDYAGSGPGALGIARSGRRRSGGGCMSDRGFRVGVDVGGTFTDLICLMPDGEVVLDKTPTTPDDRSRGVMDGLALLAARVGLDTTTFCGRIESLVHGTTTADNTMIEQDGAVTGLLVTEGHRDEIEMRRVHKEEIWNPAYPAPFPIARRRGTNPHPRASRLRGQRADLARRGRSARRHATSQEAWLHVDRGRVPAQLHERGARTARPRVGARGVPRRRAHLPQPRGRPEGARVRAHQHHAGERLRRAADRGIHDSPHRGAARRGVPGRAADHAVVRWGHAAGVRHPHAPSACSPADRPAE